MKVVLGALAAALVAGPAEEPEVWVFFSPDSPDASGIFRELRGRAARPVLLVERYAGDREPPAAFLATVAAAGADLLVVDEAGLREAERLGITELPAVAVKSGGRAHVASGSRLDVKEVLRCAKR
jgi:hypothetical protein